MNHPGFERTLRHALQTELTLRLRHTLLHGLKGPIQTVLSALHLLQKKAVAGETQDLDKYANWIKDAARELTEQLEGALPPKPTEGELIACDLHTLTEDAAHILRDEAALKEVELAMEPASAAAKVHGSEGDLRLAVMGILTSLLDAAPNGSAVRIGMAQDNGAVTWTADVAGSGRPAAQAFEPQYDLALPQSGIAWHVARGIVQELGGTLEILDSDLSGWRLKVSLPQAQKG